MMDEDSKSISLKKRWLAHHHDDEQQLDRNYFTQIHQLMRQYHFEDWQTITVLVQNQSNQYFSGKIIQIDSNGFLTVQIKDSQTFQINIWENPFGILSDNAPSIQDLTKGKYILCKKEHFYQPAIILEKTNDGKFQVQFHDEKEILSLPRQAMRLFLPPWHDGLSFFSVFSLICISNCRDFYRLGCGILSNSINSKDKSIEFIS